MRIKEIRLQQNISQKELAATLGIAPNTLSQYENEKREPDLKTLELIADFFNVSVDCLLGRGNKEKPTPGDGDGLTDDQRYLIDAIYNMSATNVKKLRIIVDQVIAEREK